MRLFGVRIDWLLRIFATLLPLVGVSCSGATNPYFEIVGEISDDTVEEFANAPSDIRTIRISSQGGDTQAAIRLAYLIRQKGLVVEVRKYCFSACAQWILPAAKRVVLINKPVVAMHHSASAFHLLLLRSKAFDQAEQYANVAEVERSFYAHSKIDKAMLFLPYLATEPVCFWPSEKANEYATFAAKWNAAVIPLADFKKFTNVQVAGAWPETIHEIEASAKEHIPDGFNLSIKPVQSEDLEKLRLSNIVLAECSMPKSILAQ